MQTSSLSISRLTFGTGNVHDLNNPEHLEVTRAAMDAGAWFHSARGYGEGGTFRVLAQAFRERPAMVPKCIFKVDGKGAHLLRETVSGCITGTGVQRINVAQVCGNPDYDQLKPGMPLYETMAQLKSDGLVENYVLEIYWPNSPNTLRILQDDLFDGYIFYYNLVQREVSNELYDALQRKQVPLLSLRGMGGGPENLWGPRDTEKAKIALADIFSRSGCKTKTEFRVRFILSVPNVVTTISATSKLAHLKELLTESQNPVPLDPGIVAEVEALHREWFAERGLD